MPQLLITSFAPWRAHQRSNSSDDLIALLESQNQIPADTALIRHLPVNFQLAPCRVISEITRTCPTIVVCCGMAEQRLLLSLERYGRSQEQTLETSIDLSRLCTGTYSTVISHDAGNYVCNHLYHQLLNHIQMKRTPIQCLFVHVPLLTRQNRDLLASDFALILSRLSQMASSVEYAVA